MICVIEYKERSRHLLWTVIRKQKSKIPKSHIFLHKDRRDPQNHQLLSMKMGYLTLDQKRPGGANLSMKQQWVLAHPLVEPVISHRASAGCQPLREAWQSSLLRSSSSRGIIQKIFLETAYISQLRDSRILYLYVQGWQVAGKPSAIKILKHCWLQKY